MFRGKYIDQLVAAAEKPRSLGYRIAVTVLAGVLILAAFPAVLFFAGLLVDRHLIVDRWRWLELGFSLVCTLAGLLFVGWSVVTLARDGNGTPSPLAPPRKLTVTGPYKLCRNPIMLGLLLYYLGLGTYFGTLAVGTVMFLIALKIGNSYHMLLEEKELERRFGEAYDEYRRNTPLLLPRLWT